MGSPRNPYAVLNVTLDAEPVVIEAAYRALMKKYHPDQGAGANGASAAEINAAFETLRDPQKRADYDHHEQTRSQAIQLARFQAALPRPAPRSSRYFGWAGWFVALVLAGALGLIASRGDREPLPRLEAAKGATPPEPELRTEPALQPVPPEELARIRADAYAVPDRPDPGPQVPLIPLIPPGKGQRPAHPRSALHDPLAPPPVAPDKEFVERHGGIY
ncbi:MAG TPA: DnaJ domain-containing protein [Allosphingosinicella sp.]|nr:DnaJ domain-containing protein [Allosphingosinicella sp.]